MSTINDESKIRARVFDVIRRILDIPPDLSTRDLRRGYLAPPHVTAFQGIDPRMLYVGQQHWLFKPAECTPAIVWPIDVCLINPNSPTGGLQVYRYTSINPRDVRGIAHRVSPHMLRLDIGADDGGKFITARTIISHLGGRWVEANTRALHGGTTRSPIYKHEKNEPSGFANAGGLAIAIALNQRYEWAVNVGFSNTPSVRIATDPTGMKELFRLRDVLPGRDRRDALMNWVSDHWRQNRHDPDVEIYVRKHMRGSTQFDWRGFNCEIVPARFDMEQIDKFIAERAAMRVAGSDRRHVEVHN